MHKHQYPHHTCKHSLSTPPPSHTHYTHAGRPWPPWLGEPHGRPIWAARHQVLIRSATSPAARDSIVRLLVEKTRNLATKLNMGADFGVGVLFANQDQCNVVGTYNVVGTCIKCNVVGTCIKWMRVAKLSTVTCLCRNTSATPFGSLGLACYRSPPSLFRLAWEWSGRCAGWGRG